MSTTNNNQNITDDKNNLEMEFNKNGRLLGLKSKTTGDIIIKLDYDNQNNFCEGFASFESKDKDNFLYYGFVHLSKKYEISPIYHTVRDFSEGFAFVRIGNKIGFIRPNGSYLVELIYDDGDSFSEGLAPVKDGNNYAFINTNGEIVIPFEYDYARRFCNGYARVKVGNKYGFIRKDGSFLMKPKYGEACDFCNGYACIETSDKIRSVKVGRIDTNGNEYWDNEYYN